MESLRGKIDLTQFSMSLYSLVLGLGLGAALLTVAGADPVIAYLTIIEGSFGSLYRIGETLIKITPFMWAGLGVAVGFKSGYWNIGAEGQIIIGALLTVWGGHFFQLPQPLHIMFCVILGFIGGGLWSLVAGALKAKLGINEVLTTLMLNYVALWLAHYFIHGPWEDPSKVWAQTFSVLDSAKLPKILPGTRAHLGIILAVATAVILHQLLSKSVLGYRLRAVGENPTASKAAGIDTVKIMLLASFLSGALAGLAGVSEILGVHFFLEDGLTEGYGYTSIAVAMLGGLSPMGTLLSASFFGFLINGSNYMQRGVNIPTTTVHVFVGLIILSMLMTPLIKKAITRLGAK
jgi:simple sugar transport system permease protein